MSLEDGVVSRRVMMAGGGAAVLAALGYRALDRGAVLAGNGAAFDAWRDAAGRPGEGSLRPLHAAVLAASAHNSQPWAFAPQDDAITVYADLSRHLGAADPFRRELYVSLGCALYNLGLACAHSPAVPLPDIDDRALEPNPSSRFDRFCDFLLLKGSPWAHSDRRAEWAALATRHTDRGPYLQGRRLPETYISAYSLPYFVTDPEAVKALGALIVEATERFIADGDMSRDAGIWMRTGRREVEAHRDGVTIDTAGLSPLVTGLAKILPDQDNATAGRYWLQSVRDVQVPTASAYGVIFSQDRLRLIDAVSVGAAWQGLHLKAAMAGLSVQPMNAPVEMMDRDHFLGRPNAYAKEIAKIAAPSGTGGEGSDVAFIFRIGYGTRMAQPSPRRRFSDVLHQKGYA